MRQEQVDALAGEAFAQIVSLLRPVARRQGASDSFAEAERTPTPAQRLELRLCCNGPRVSADLQVWLRCPPQQALVAVWVLPLSPGATVESLALRRASQSGEPAGLCERREARNWFELARRSGVPGALLSEDAPSVFSLEVAGPAGESVCAALSYNYRRAGGDDGEMIVCCEAAPGSLPMAAERPRILRLGSGRTLDRVAGITPATSPMASRGGLPSNLHGGSSAPPRPEVFASYDRDGGSSAMFRGTLAGRSVRLWAELRREAGAGRVAAPLCDGDELERLMGEYRRPERTEAERHALAAEVARLGMEMGRATLWTSFVAVAGGEGPGGEMVFAAA